MANIWSPELFTRQLRHRRIKSVKMFPGQYIILSAQSIMLSTQYTVHNTQYTVHNTQYTFHNNQYPARKSVNST